MPSLFDSLARYVASLSQADFDAVMDARPDAAEALFGHVPEGESRYADVRAIVEALSRPDGLFEVVLRLSRPELQVLMALYEAAVSALNGRAAKRLRQARYEASYQLEGRFESDLLTMYRYYGYGEKLEADVGLAREALCGPPATEAARAAAAEFDRIVAYLTSTCLVWPEEGTGRLRLHDVALLRLPEPTREWQGFDPVPPAPRVAGWLPVERVDAEAQAMATSALERCERLLRQIAQEPVPLLKAGGVGVREVKRLVRTCGLDEPAVRFWLTVAHNVALVAAQDGKLLATAEYDQWVSAEPSRRYALLFGGWMSLGTSVLGPFADLDQVGRPPAVLSEAATDGVGHFVRGAVLGAVTDCGAGAVPDPAFLAEAVRWRLPLLMEPVVIDCDCGEDHGLGEQQVADAAVTTVLTEGAVLGAVALGTAAPLVRLTFTPELSEALAALDESGNSGDSDPAGAEAVEAAVAAALAATLPAATERVRLQGDMTVVATGLPSARLAAFFDAAADRESAGTATVWRISDGSVRRWLDAGRSADDLLAGLAECCEDALPQALRYLIEDAARRHGLVDVVAAQSVVVAADARLGAELAVLPALVSLGARKLADTVLVVDAPQQQVLSVLRFAGYLPSAHQADGSPSGAVVAAPRAAPEASVRWVEDFPG